MNDMTQTPATDRLTLVSGLAGLVIIILFVVSNFALGGVDPPEPSASAEEVSEFFIGKGGSLEWDAGMRYVVFFLFPIFAFGLARRVRTSDALAGTLGN